MSTTIRRMMLATVLGAAMVAASATATVTAPVFGSQVAVAVAADDDGGDDDGGDDDGADDDDAPTGAVPPGQGAQANVGDDDDDRDDDSGAVPVGGVDTGFGGTAERGVDWSSVGVLGGAGVLTTAGVWLFRRFGAES